MTYRSPMEGRSKKMAGRPLAEWVQTLANLEFNEEFIEYPQLCELLGQKNRTIHAFIERLGVEGEYHQTEGKVVRKRYKWTALREAVCLHIKQRQGLE